MFDLEELSDRSLVELHHRLEGGPDIFRDDYYGNKVRKEWLDNKHDGLTDLWTAVNGILKERGINPSLPPVKDFDLGDGNTVKKDRDYLAFELDICINRRWTKTGVLELINTLKILIAMAEHGDPTFLDWNKATEFGHTPVYLGDTIRYGDVSIAVSKLTELEEWINED